MTTTTGLKATLQHDLTEAIRAKDKVRAGSLRMALTAIANEEVAGKEHRDLSEDEGVGVPQLFRVKGIYFRDPDFSPVVVLFPIGTEVLRQQPVAQQVHQGGEQVALSQVASGAEQQE